MQEFALFTLLRFPFDECSNAVFYNKLVGRDTRSNKDSTSCNGIRYLQSRSFPKIIDTITFSLSSAQLERSVISVKEIGQIFPVSKGKWV